MILRPGNGLHPCSQRRCVYGIDFSGSINAGNKIWIADCLIEGDGISVVHCFQAKDLEEEAGERDRCLATLQRFIARHPRHVFGLDFPFGLPMGLLPNGDWEEFVRTFPDLYPDAEKFRSTCSRCGGGAELKRVTDRERKTPFSPYNLRMYRQTYDGLRDLLGPLVRAEAACVLPMQTIAHDRPWLLEICPASTLRLLDLARSYKGRSEECLRARRTIWRALQTEQRVTVSDRSTRKRILEDPEGDALDSVLAALAVWSALCNPSGLLPVGDDEYQTEGYVYV